MSAKRAEAKFREEKERALKLEKELEMMKMRSGSASSGSGIGGMRRVNSGWIGSSEFGEDNGVDIPQRKSSLRREMSMSKGFL